MQSCHSRRTVQVQAPAKVNLFLEISGKRADGFHELETFMTTVSLYDTLSFSRSHNKSHTASHNRDEQYTKESIRLECGWATAYAVHVSDGIPRTAHRPESNWGGLPEGRDNLAVKAVERLQAVAGIDESVSIRIRKRIPSAAGLGGASSDAAAALFAVNRLWQLNWPVARLAEIAAELGSDVPFFLASGAAICRGRGEKVEETTLPRMHFVIVSPPRPLATQTVYQHCRPAPFPVSIEPFQDHLESGDIVQAARTMVNRLQQPAEDLSPEVRRLRQAFEGIDCLGHQMSGSGSSYFGICRNARHARRVARRLRALRLGMVFVTRSVPGATWVELASQT